MKNDWLCGRCGQKHHVDVNEPCPTCAKVDPLIETLCKQLPGPNLETMAWHYTNHLTRVPGDDSILVRRHSGFSSVRIELGWLRSDLMEPILNAIAGVVLTAPKQSKPDSP